MNHAGKRLFITGIPTSGKSYLAKRLAKSLGGVAVSLDSFRERLAADERYKKWVNFYLDRDEKEYLTKTSPGGQWQNLVAQSEALWPAILDEIKQYEREERLVVFECVNLLPHLAQRDLGFPGIVLIGSSFEETLARNKKDPRWGATAELQELEAGAFFEVERPRYKVEAERYGYPVFESADAAFESAQKLLG
ncbi:MAG TPA: AAA family ATPase [Candidatus Paceibacterota bacterium]|nr:AAA family ATPase [Candidatus Paceibacterota bacterium]